MFVIYQGIDTIITSPNKCFSQHQATLVFAADRLGFLQIQINSELSTWR